MSEIAEQAVDAHLPVHHTVTVNTEEKIVDRNVLDFHQVCLLAFPDGPFGEGIVYSVLYHYKHSHEEKILSKGQTVEIRDGMVFDVDNADRS